MPTINAAAAEMEVKDDATTETAVKTKTGGSKMETAKKAVKEVKVDYKDHKAVGKLLVDMALAKGVKVAKEYGKATLKLGNVAPWDNPFHAMKNISKTNKEQLLKAVAIVLVKKDNPDGNKHVIDGVIGKLTANFAGKPDFLKKEEDCIKAAKKYAKDAK